MADPNANPRPGGPVDEATAPNLEPQTEPVPYPPRDVARMEAPPDPPPSDPFGPHAAYPTGRRLDTGVVPDRLVNTHCCYCGQQCGIRLKVKDDEVLGFEPWYDFPFNKGKLCPKGIKRYLQSGHPDRLLHAYERDADAPGGFREMPYARAIERVASEIDRIQSTYGNDAFAVLTGASLTSEKSYLMGKFAHMALRTANIDYNGRLCMVSAGGGNNLAFGVDRGANPWTDILRAEVVWASGANIAECAPITTDYVWQARENGGKLIIVDPRMTPIARTADLYLPVKPGRDVALFNGVLREMIAHDWIDHAFIERYTIGFDALARHVEPWTLDRTAEVTGVARKRIEAASELWGTAKTSFMMHSRGIEHSAHGVQNVLGAINLVLASGRIGRPYCGYSTITGQGNGQGAREHGSKKDQLPGMRELADPEARRYVAGVWGMDPDDLPQPGADAYEIFRKVAKDEIRGLLLICFNPLVSLPDNQFIRAQMERLEFFVTIDFFMSESARHSHVVLPGSLHEEDEGVVATNESRVVKINKCIDPPGEAKQDWRIIQDICRALGREEGFTFESPREIFDELRIASKGGKADYSGITYEKIEAQYGVFWPCYAESPEGEPIDHRGTPRMFEPGSWNPIAKGAGPFYFPDGKARFCRPNYFPPTEDTDDAYPLMLTTGRVISQFLSGTQTRRIGPLLDMYPTPRVELHPRLAAQLGVEDGAWVTVETRRGAMTLRAQVVRTIRPDTIFIPYHWASRRSANQLTLSAQDPISKIPEFKACAAKLRQARPDEIPEAADEPPVPRAHPRPEPAPERT